MNETLFEQFLLEDEGITSKNKAVSTRMSKGRAVEKNFGSLDIIVASDIEMHRVLVEINQKMKNANGSYSNALRKYYTFKNGRDFPRIADFEREHNM